jgi:hypothetical protein
MQTSASSAGENIVKKLLAVLFLAFAAVHNSFSAPPPTSVEQLRNEFENALKTGDTNALISLFNWEGVSDDGKSAKIRLITNYFLGKKIESLKLSPLPVGYSAETEMYGISYSQNVSVVGMIKVQSAEEAGTNNSSHSVVGEFPYGKKDNYFCLAGTVERKVSASAVKEKLRAVVSSITDYQFNPNPEEPAPKMYNWEVMLDTADSTNGTYEIVQITKPIKQDAKASDTITNVLIDRDRLDNNAMIGTNEDGIIDFKLYIGDKEPTQNMNGRGKIGQPVIFSGAGKGSSTWVVLPGSKVDQTAPSDKGTKLSDGKLNLISYVVSNDGGDKFQVDVMLCRKTN